MKFNLQWILISILGALLVFAVVIQFIGERNEQKFSNTITLEDSLGMQVVNNTRDTISVTFPPDPNVGYVVFPGDTWKSKYTIHQGLVINKYPYRYMRWELSNSFYRDIYTGEKPKKGKKIRQ